MAVYKPPLVACPIAASCVTAEAESGRLCQDPCGCQHSSRECPRLPNVLTNRRVSHAPSLFSRQSGACEGRAAA